MFAVLRRSRKLRDSAFSLVAFSTCGETETAVQCLPSFSVWVKAEVWCSYVGWREDDMWSFHSVLQSHWPQQDFCFLKTATRNQPARRLWNQPDRQTVKNVLVEIGEGSHWFFIKLWWEWLWSRPRLQMIWEAWQKVVKNLLHAPKYKMLTLSLGPGFKCIFQICVGC